MRAHALVLACALLAACTGDPAEPQPNQAEAEVATTEEAPGNAASPSTESDKPSTAPAAAPIPAAFRGTWAENETLCGDPSHHSRLVIAGGTLRFHDRVVEVARVEAPGPREINIIGTEPGEGTTRPAEHHFSIDSAGDTLTDQAGGGTVRRRCGG